MVGCSVLDIRDCPLRVASSKTVGNNLIKILKTINAEMIETHK